MERLGCRRGDLKNMMTDDKGRVRLDYIIPSRALIGFHNDFLTLTSGTGIMHHVFSHYGLQQKVKFHIVKMVYSFPIKQGIALAYSLLTCKNAAAC